jgi:hypothetical protein
MRLLFYCFFFSQNLLSNETFCTLVRLPLLTSFFSLNACNAANCAEVSEILEVVIFVQEKCKEFTVGGGHNRGL